jgi:hypothetical protein
LLTPQFAIPAASVVIALASLGLAVYTGWVTRRHFRHTLRPIINVDTDISPTQERYSILLHNCGPGVAIIKSWSLTIAGMKPEDLGKMSSRALTDALGYPALIDFTHYFAGDALQSGERIEIIGTKAVAQTEEECESFKNCLKKIRVEFAYASVYEEVWEKMYDGEKENERV